MVQKNIRFLGAATILAFLASAAQAQPAGMPPEVQEQMRRAMEAAGKGNAGTADPAGAAKQAEIASQMLAEPIILTEPQVTGFLGVVKDLQALGDEAGGWSKTQPGDPQALGAGMHFSAAAQEIIRKHGFADPTELQRVGYNAALAYAVLEKGGKQAVQQELAKSKQQQAEAMAQMEKHLGKEQAEAMQAQMATGSQMTKSLEEVPDSNIDLIAKYRGQMEGLSKRK